MDIPSTSKVKDEPVEERPPNFVSNVMPSEGLIEFFLDNEYKRNDVNYHYSQVKCLDETDGKLKYFNDLLSNHVTPVLEGDYKNHCSKCDKHFDNLLAAQNHYVFNHPCSSMLTTVRRGANNSIAHTKRDYNWLDEPIPWKAPPKNTEESPNIIIIKDKEEYLKKLSTTQKLVHVTEEVRTPTKGFTLESIKAYPQEGIRVVKKSDIKFDQLRSQAEQKLLFIKKPEPRIGEAPSRKNNEPERQLMKIDINEAFKGRSKHDAVSFTKEFLALLRKPQKGVKYLCRRCNLEMFDPYVFDVHMRQHINATFICPFCTKTFCTKIGIANHIDTCKKDSANTIVKIVRLPKKK